jgi:hypothetical protein
METPSRMRNISKNSAALAKNYSGEIKTATRLANTGGAIDGYRPQIKAPPSLPDHARMFREFLESEDFVLGIDDLFSDDVLKQKIKKIIEDSRLKQHLPPGETVQLAFIPFDEFGAPLDDDAVGRGDYIRLLVLKNISANPAKPEYRVEWGFSMFPNFINRLMPKELQDITFVSSGDARNIAGSLAEAFYRLKEVLRKYFSN